MHGFNRDALAARTSPEFADAIQRQITHQEMLREITLYREQQEDDTLVVDILTGWAGRTHALWTYRYKDGECDISVVNCWQVSKYYGEIDLDYDTATAEQVERYEAAIKESRG